MRTAAAAAAPPLSSQSHQSLTRRGDNAAGIEGTGRALRLEGGAGVGERVDQDVKEGGELVRVRRAEEGDARGRIRSVSSRTTTRSAASPVRANSASCRGSVALTSTMWGRVSSPPPRVASATTVPLWTRAWPTRRSDAANCASRDSPPVTIVAVRGVNLAYF